MYLIQCLTFWPVPLILKFTGVEKYDIEELPYQYAVPSWLAFGSAAIVYGYGLVVSTPFFMSIGELLVLALNTGGLQGTFLCALPLDNCCLFA